MHQVNQNINRWREQVGLKPRPLDQQRADLKSIKLDNRPSVWVQIDGPEKSIVGVITVRGDRAWFKMHGPKNEVKSELPRFKQFTTAARFVAE